MKTAIRVMLCSLAFLLLCSAINNSATAAPDSKGTDFWLMFNSNLGTGELTLFITGDVNTTGTVSIPGLGFSTPFSVTAGTVTSVVIPGSAQMVTADGVESKGIHVVSVAEVTVYGLNRITATTDAYLGLPTDILGMEYIVLGYSNTTVHSSAATEFGIVGTQNTTNVTITPVITTGPRIAGVPYVIVLNQGQAYQLKNTGFGPSFDLTGTIITSDKPIGVFGGNQCTNIPATGFVACDHVIEMLPPTSAWGQSFLTVPLATRLNGDTWRFLAQTNSTTVNVNGAPVATLNRGERHEMILTGLNTITANHPILVAQYSNSSSFDNVTSDPFEMLIPPFEQFLGGYTITTPASGFAINRVNVVAPNAAVGSVTLDGAPIPAASFTPIGASGFSGAQVPVTLGSHNFGGNLPFGVFVYGYASFDSYGYPGGQSLSPIATVTSLVLAPRNATNPVNTQHCVTATVRDQNNLPLNGIRVDFLVTGVNPNAGFATTGTNGEAQFCYTGTNAGNDGIVGSVGTLRDSVSKTWTSGPPPDQTAPNCVLTNVIPGPPKVIQVTVSDAGSGLGTVQVLTATNCNVVVPAFTPGTTSPVVVSATKINQSQAATVILRVTDVAQNSVVCDPVFTTISGEIPEEFTLATNYPNPFNPTTSINFNIAKSFAGGMVSLKVYDMLGREVTTLINEPMDPGQYSVQWDATNSHGERVQSGVYVYRLTAGAFTATKKMTLLK